MIAVTIKFLGFNNMSKWAKSVIDAETEALRLKLVKAATEIHKNVIHLIQKQSNGEIKMMYQRGRQPRAIVVSKPGDPPNSQTGMLLRSYKFKIDMATKTAKVYSNSKYAPHLEFGTKDMSARPHLLPAFEMYLEKYRGKK